jgi:D-beta-D-heptose 7-phosphate kinase/D-beta-D-heptose 1-phosphate adenosyltransferase
MSHKLDGKPVVVAVSGGFDPIHPGHIQLFKEAKELGDELVVIINNDFWLMKKKKYVFMSQKERAKIIESIRYVDRVYVTDHGADTEDMSVSEAILKIKPDIFANGGDRNRKNVPETEACEKVGCKMAFNVGKDGKIQSSSWLVEKAIKTAPRKVAVKFKNKK